MTSKYNSKELVPVLVRRILGFNRVKCSVRKTGTETCIINKNGDIIAVFRLPRNGNGLCTSHVSSLCTTQWCALFKRCYKTIINYMNLTLRVYIINKVRVVVKWSLMNSLFIITSLSNVIQRSCNATITLIGKGNVLKTFSNRDKRCSCSSRDSGVYGSVAKQAERVRLKI